MRRKKNKKIFIYRKLFISRNHGGNVMRMAVLMSTFNGERYLKAQIDSIIKQKCSFNIDIWVRDDGSSDGTLNILNEFQKNGKLKWYAGKNIGPASSFIELLSNCPKYDFYSLADQDDVWYQGKADAAVRSFSSQLNNCPVLYFSNALLTDKNLNSLGRNVYKRDQIQNLFKISCAGGILGCTIVFNNSLAKIIKEANITDTDSIVMHDFFLAEVCAAVGGKIIFDKRSYISYRQHANNVVGVSINKTVAIKSRVRAIFIRPKISIADQAHFILDVFSKYISNENKKWLMKVSNYRNGFFPALFLGLSQKVRYSSWNMSFKIRLAIIFRNR